MNGLVNTLQVLPSVITLNYMKTKIIPREILVKEYRVNNQKNLASKYGVSNSAIQNWLRKYDITKEIEWRGGWNKKNFCSKEELSNLYLEKYLSSIEIGKKFGVEKSVVLSRLRDFNIKRRNNSEARKGKFDGENSPSFRGAIYKTRFGYQMKKLLLGERGEHRADKSHRVYVHTYTMEKYLGRKLREGEIVHHLDCNRSNNNISNLVLFPNQDEHIKFHKFIEHLGMFNVGILKEKPVYKFSTDSFIPKEVKLTL